MPSSSRLSAKARRAFLAHLAQSANVSASCAAAGVPRRAVYAHKARSSAFAAAWDAALDSALDGLEAALLERAIAGTSKTLYYGGKPVGEETQFSDALAMFLLKSRRPLIYGDIKAIARAQVDGDDEGYEAAFARLSDALHAMRRNGDDSDDVDGSGDG